MSTNTLAVIKWREDIASYEITFPDYTIGHAADKKKARQAIIEWSRENKRVTVIWEEKWNKFAETYISKPKRVTAIFEEEWNQFEEISKRKVTT